jgi:hypothetical protein
MDQLMVHRSSAKKHKTERHLSVHREHCGGPAIPARGEILYRAHPDFQDRYRGPGTHGRQWRQKTLIHPLVAEMALLERVSLSVKGHGTSLKQRLKR